MARREINPTDLHAHTVAREQDAKVQHVIRRGEIEDFHWLMSDRRGRNFVWRLLDKAGVFRSTFRLNNEMAFLEGMRNIGLMLIAEIHEICPESYQLMVKEAKENADRSNAARRN